MYITKNAIIKHKTMITSQYIFIIHIDDIFKANGLTHNILPNGINGIHHKK